MMEDEEVRGGEQKVSLMTLTTNKRNRNQNTTGRQLSVQDNHSSQTVLVFSLSLSPAADGGSAGGSPTATCSEPHGL